MKTVRSGKLHDGLAYICVQSTQWPTDVF